MTARVGQKAPDFAAPAHEDRLLHADRQSIGRGFLRNDADALSQKIKIPILAQVMPQSDHPAFIRPERPIGDLEQRRLPGSVCADDRNDISPLNKEGDVLQSLNGTIKDIHTFDFNHRRSLPRDRR